MRVLYIVGTYPPAHCGIGDYTETLVDAFSRLPDVVVAVLTTSASGRSPKNVEIIENSDGWEFDDLPRIFRSITAWRPDIVHFQYPSQNFFGHASSMLPILCRLKGMQVIQTWHEPHRLRGTGHFLLQCLGAKALIFVRPNYLQLLPVCFRAIVDAIPHTVIPNASALPLSTLNDAKRAELKKRYLGSSRRLIVFFGFLYPNKGIESLFDIASLVDDSIVISGGNNDPDYVARLRAYARTKGWPDDKIHFTGFLEKSLAADVLSIADAVILPFLEGGGEWNTSIHSALAQGTLVITTSLKPRGFDPSRNLYTAGISDISDMRSALNQLAGRRLSPISPNDQWQLIAQMHLNFYAHATALTSSRNGTFK